MRRVLLAIVPYVFAMGAHAQVCGDPPPVANEQVKADLIGKASLLSRYFGSAELGGKIDASRTEIFSKYPPGERSEAYFQYQICILLMQDTKMSTSEKIKELLGTRDRFRQPPAKVKAGPPVNSRAGDDPSDGPDVRACVTADPGWEVKPKSGHLIQDEAANGGPGFTGSQETESYYCGSFHVVRHNRGRSASLTMHAEIVQMPIPCRKSFETKVKFSQRAGVTIGETKPVPSPSGWFFDPSTARVGAPDVIHGGGGGHADMFELHNPSRTTLGVHARSIAGTNPIWFEVPVFAELVPINPPEGCPSPRL